MLLPGVLFFLVGGGFSGFWGVSVLDPLYESDVSLSLGCLRTMTLTAHSLRCSSLLLWVLIVFVMIDNQVAQPRSFERVLFIVLLLVGASTQSRYPLIIILSFYMVGTPLSVIVVLLVFLVIVVML